MAGSYQMSTVIVIKKNWFDWFFVVLCLTATCNCTLAGRKTKELGWENLPASGVQKKTKRAVKTRARRKKHPRRRESRKQKPWASLCEGFRLSLERQLIAALSRSPLVICEN